MRSQKLRLGQSKKKEQPKSPWEMTCNQFRLSGQHVMIPILAEEKDENDYEFFNGYALAADNWIEPDEFGWPVLRLTEASVLIGRALPIWTDELVRILTGLDGHEVAAILRAKTVFGNRTKLVEHTKKEESEECPW